MLTPRRLRHLVASFSLALVCFVTQAPAFARTQEANFIRLVATAAADLPSGVRGDLLLANDGNIYYTALTGGTSNLGSIAKLAPDGTISTLYAITDANQGGNPYAGVIQANDGNLYGTTFAGGVNGRGAVFRVSLTGTYQLLRSLGETATDADRPYTGLVQAGDGKLYGTTLLGGNNNKGTIFRLSLSGSDYEVIHHFSGDDGENPEGTLIIGSDNELYGTTLQGGPANRGTIYRISTSGSFTSIYSFPSLSAFSGGVAVNATGANPRARLLLAADGNYYGTTFQGGPAGFGTVFRMTQAGVVSVLHSFGGPLKSATAPLAGVVQDAAGNFYGTTSGNAELGGSDLGGAWRISSAGEFNLLHAFNDVADGLNPRAGLLLANGSIYGASYTDSQLNRGAIFKLDLGSGGALPVELSASPAEITAAISGTNSSTISWSSPTAASCTSSGAWGSSVSTTSGERVVTPTQPGIYTYGLSCTDGAGVLRYMQTALTVKPPTLETVDGGGGAGALSVSLLLLLAALLFRKSSREIFSA